MAQEDSKGPGFSRLTRAERAIPLHLCLREPGKCSFLLDLWLVVCCSGGGIPPTLFICVGESWLLPLDFSLISGRSLTSTHVPLGENLTLNSFHVRKLIDPFANILPPGLSYASHKDMAMGCSMLGTSDEQRVPILMWLAICGLLRTNNRSRATTRFLRPLVDLSLVHTYDWIELGYCSLLSCLQASEWWWTGLPFRSLETSRGMILQIVGILRCYRDWTRRCIVATYLVLWLLSRKTA